MTEASRTLVDCTPGIPAHAVRVAWESAVGSASAEAHARMDTCWTDALAEAEAQGRTLFDSAITRLIAAEANDNPATSVLLRLGPGSYKGFVVTRLRDAAWFEAHAPSLLTAGLGNSALLTHGDHVLLGIRSERVSCYPGRAHLIGGVLDELDLDTLPSADGLVAHLLLELHEEARIGHADLAPRGPWPKLLGIFEDRALGQPEAIWQWETRLPLPEIAQRLDPAEHSGHLVLRRAGASAEVLSRLTPLASVAYHAWSRQLPNNP
jgi:hypothetical protein